MMDKTNVADRLTIGELEQWLWDAACEIRGATDAPKFKDFILPLNWESQEKLRRAVAIGEAMGHPRTETYRQLLAQVRAEM